MKTCPLCLGTGYAKQPTKNEKEMRRLRKQGLTVRQIAKVLGLGSTTVFYHLSKETRG